MQPRLDLLLLRKRIRSCSLTLQALWIMLGAGSSCWLFCLSLMFCLFCISEALLWMMFWLMFLFFSPRGFSNMASEGFTSFDDLSLPTSLWGQCHLPLQTGSRQAQASVSNPKSCGFLPFVSDGNSASPNRSPPLSHHVCYSVCRERSTMNPTLKATFNTQPVMTRTRSTSLPRPTTLNLQLCMLSVCTDI